MKILRNAFQLLTKRVGGRIETFSMSGVLRYIFSEGSQKIQNFEAKLRVFYVYGGVVTTKNI